MVSNVTVSTVEVSPKGMENRGEGVHEFWRKFFHSKKGSGFSGQPGFLTSHTNPKRKRGPGQTLSSLALRVSVGALSPVGAAW
jgi:hypothetical protein